jgi:hypothetical protein|nr:MAG TPA: ECF sigma factor [Caudoviricetes sp.]
MECKGRTFTESEVEAIVKIAAETAAQTALTEFNRRNEDMLAKKNERAYKNTTTLLEGYTAMKAHCKSAIAKAEDTLTPSDLQTVLYEVFNRRGLLQIETILASKRRTELIIEHIDKMLEVYRITCINNNKHYCECVIDRYINDLTIAEIAEKHNTVERNVYRWLDKGIDDLSIYLFGAYAL